MTPEEHTLIAKTLKASAESFPPADRLVYHAAYYSVAMHLSAALEGNNPDDFRHKLFMKEAGFDVIDDRERRRTPPWKVGEGPQ